MRLEFWFNGFMVVSVGAGFSAAQNFAFGHFTDEQGVASQLHLFQHLAAKHSAGVVGDIAKTIVAALYSGKISELIHFSAGLHTEMADGLKRHILSQCADVKSTGFLNDLTGQISLLDRNG